MTGGLAVVVAGLFGPIAGLPLPGGGRPVVVVFLDAGCPLANRYAPVLDQFAERFDDRVAVLGVMENGGDAPAFVRRHRLRYPVVPDRDASFADRVRAVRTPEVVLLDSHRRIRYRGRVDDRYGVGGKDRGRATRDDLADAVADLLAGRPVAVPVTPAAGCAIGRPRPTRRDSVVTYARDVAGILDRRCAGCHAAGGIGPFPLTTFTGAKSRASAVAEAVADGRMPPWHASPDYGTFRNDPRLTAAEKQRIADWVAAGCPEGDPNERPAPPATPSGWAIGTPDVVLRIPQPFRVPAAGEIEYQHFFVETGFPTDVWIRAAEIRPGNPRVVHHCNVFLHAPSSTDPTDKFLTGPFQTNNLAVYTPGTGPTRFPDGTAMRIPAGWTLHFNLHYTAVGSVEEDRTEIGLKLVPADQVRREVGTILLDDPGLSIPPNTAAHRVERTWTADRDTWLYAMSPHMHLRGKSFRYSAEYPDGTAEVLLDVPAYDFHWQHRYELAEPKRLPAGTTLRCTAVYDNSADNPANPDPAVTVRYGPQSWDEMFIGYFDVAAAGHDRVAESAAAATRQNWMIAVGIVSICGLGLLARRVAGPGRAPTPSPVGSRRRS
jgi:hypothetical protein